MPSVDYCYFPSQEKLLSMGISINLDKNYYSDEARVRDLAWTAFQSGYINATKENGLNIWSQYSIPVVDEYRFLNKNFNKAWVVYVLLIRLFTFHNPIAEIFSFFKVVKVKRTDFSKNVIQNKDYEEFRSDLIMSNPFVSIIIPTLNRYRYLKDVLIDLENQTYKNFEVIIVDQTDDFKKDFYEGWKLNLRFWYQEEKALWKARNEAIKSAKGDYVLLYDDDSLIENNWIEEHLKCLDYFDADISSGVSISKVGDVVPKHYSYFRYSDQLDTGNVLFKKVIFDKIGYFDLKFEKQRMGDGEYGMRAYLNGYKNISNYKAQRVHLKVEQGGLRQMGSWDGWRPKKLFGPRPVPSVLYFSRKYFGSKATIYYIMHSILPSFVPYRFKRSKILKMLSFFLIPFLLPLVLIQISRSWSLATLKINE